MMRPAEIQFLAQSESGGVLNRDLEARIRRRSLKSVGERTPFKSESPGVAEAQLVQETSC